MQQLVWAVVIAGAIVLLWLPVIIAAIRGTEPIWPVVLLVVLTPLGGVTWFAAWIPALAFPRRRPAPARRPALPPRDDPRCLFGGVPPVDAALDQPRAIAGSGVSV